WRPPHRVQRRPGGFTSPKARRPMSRLPGRPWTIQNIRQCAGAGGACRFAVTLERGKDCINDLKMEAATLLDYAAFQARVLETSGRLVRVAAVESAADPAVAWLDLVE